MFRDGFVVALLNPKTSLFFAAFLPQFMNPQGSALAQTDPVQWSAGAASPVPGAHEQSVDGMLLSSDGLVAEAHGGPSVSVPETKGDRGQGDHHHVGGEEPDRDEGALGADPDQVGVHRGLQEQIGADGPHREEGEHGEEEPAETGPQP